MNAPGRHPTWGVLPRLLSPNRSRPLRHPPKPLRLRLRFKLSNRSLRHRWSRPQPFQRRSQNPKPPALARQEHGRLCPRPRMHPALRPHLKCRHPNRFAKPSLPKNLSKQHRSVVQHPRLARHRRKGPPQNVSPKSNSRTPKSSRVSQPGGIRTTRTPDSQLCLPQHRY